MRRITVSIVTSFVLAAFLLAPAASNAGGEAHPLIKRAISALQSARADLQNAAHDYCGHRVEALEATNAALNQLHQALDCASRTNHSANTEREVDPISSAGERHPNISRAVTALEAAENDLQNAAHDYCGHRVEALESVRAALNQLRLALECKS